MEHKGIYTMSYMKHITHAIGLLGNIDNKLDLIINNINRGIKHMSVEFDNLTTQVKANSEVLDSAIVLINGIADRITAAGVDPVKLNALTTELKAKDEALAAAVAANTVASPPVA